MSMKQWAAVRMKRSSRTVPPQKAVLRSQFSTQATDLPQTGPCQSKSHCMEWARAMSGYVAVTRAHAKACFGESGKRSGRTVKPHSGNVASRPPIIRRRAPRLLRTSRGRSRPNAWTGVAYLGSSAPQVGSSAMTRAMLMTHARAMQGGSPKLEFGGVFRFVVPAEFGGRFTRVASRGTRFSRDTPVLCVKKTRFFQKKIKKIVQSGLVAGRQGQPARP